MVVDQEQDSGKKTTRQISAEQKKKDTFSLDAAAMQQSVLMQDYKGNSKDDPVIQRLKMAQHIMRKSGNLTLKPLLPLLLSIRGKPYTLQDHFPFAPFFRTRMPRITLLKAGRQVSKSTSLAAQGVILSNCIPYFSTLYIAPLFEMIRRFSQNYVAPFIDTSPVGRLFSGQTTTNNVLQRSFKNQSQMIFSFAHLDAERTRGISADKNCLVTGTPITLSDGSELAIEKMLPGISLLSADKNGIVCLDTVTELLNRGKQHVFRVEFSNGSKIECTADERFRKATDGEWVYLSALVPEAKEISQKSTGSRLAYAARGRGFNLQPATNALRLFARRRGNPTSIANVELAGVLPARIEAEGVLREQGKSTPQRCTDSGSPSGQRGIRGDVYCIRDSFQPDIQGDRGTNHGKRSKIGYKSLGRSTGLGSNRLLVHGRRESVKGQERLQLQHSRFLAGRVSAAGESTTGVRNRLQRSFCSGEEDRQGVLHDTPGCRRLAKTCVDGRTLDARNDEVQTSRTEALGDLLGMQRTVSGAKGSSSCSGAELLPGRVLDGQRTKAEAGIYDPRTSANQERQAEGEVCCEVVIVKVSYAGVVQVWDINTAKEHCFFAADINCHNCVDEVQDMDIAFLPIIHETISASKDWGIIQYAGTPKSLDNTIEHLWSSSSMAEWTIKCPHAGCGHWNIPSLDYDLLRMIGPVHKEISERCPGLICAKCAKPISPRPPHQGGTGRWIHRHPSRRWESAGYHIPQIIMPTHYANPEKWQSLVDKQNGRGNVPINVFYNEVCGESWDSGSKLVTITELKNAACLPWPCLAEEAQKHIDHYSYRFVAVDWGGGGASHGKSVLARQSYTSLAVLGLTPDGRVDVIYGFRSMHPHDHVREAKLVLGVMHTFRCSHVVHDYTGAGTVRETILLQAGLSANSILPVVYTGPAQGGLINFKPATEDHPRNRYNMDRNRALSYCCQFIKSGIIRFFQYDYKGSEDIGLIHDFLNLVEDKAESSTGRDHYKILRDPAGPDDFAQAVTMGTLMLFQMAGQFPDLASYEDVRISEGAALASRGPQTLDWD